MPLEDIAVSRQPKKEPKKESSEDGMQVLLTEIPQAELAKYATELRSMTQGQGTFEMSFARYEMVPPNVANEIIAKFKAEHGEEED